MPNKALWVIAMLVFALAVWVISATLVTNGRNNETLDVNHLHVLPMGEQIMFRDEATNQIVELTYLGMLSKDIYKIKVHAFYSINGMFLNRKFNKYINVYGYKARFQYKVVDVNSSKLFIECPFGQKRM